MLSFLPPVRMQTGVSQNNLSSDICWDGDRESVVSIDRQDWEWNGIWTGKIICKALSPKHWGWAQQESYYLLSQYIHLSPPSLWEKTKRKEKTKTFSALDSCNLSIFTFTSFLCYHFLTSWSILIICCTYWHLIHCLLPCHRSEWLKGSERWPSRHLGSWVIWLSHLQHFCPPSILSHHSYCDIPELIHY